jgi:predicted nucleic-acid-binding protein
MWADTNILVRLATGLPVEQHAALTGFLEQRTAPIYVHAAHVCEAIFVLEGHFYLMTAVEATQSLGTALSIEKFIVQDYAAVARALATYPSSNLDFPDVLICELARVDGTQVLSFDRKMARLGVQIIKP